MPSISFLGTGSGVPSADRFFSSNLLHLDGRLFLIDAGEPCVHLLRDRGDLLCEINAVLITHGHVDHIGGLPALLQGCMLLGRTKDLSIHLPGEMIAPLRSWMEALYLTEKGLGFSLSWNAWEDRMAVDLGNGISATPWPNEHLKATCLLLDGFDPARACQSYSLEILSEGFRALFSGDLCSAAELGALVAKQTTVLVSELSHFSAGELALALEGVGMNALCLVHLSEEYASGRSELKRRLEELLPGVSDVFLPEDGEILDF